MTKRKILFTLGGLGGGGAERNLINFLTHFNRNLLDADVFTYFKTGVYVQKIPEDVNLKYIAKGTEYYTGAIAPISNKINKKKVKFLRSIAPQKLYKSINYKQYDIEIGVLHDILKFVAKSPIKRKIGFIRNDLTYDLNKKNQQLLLEASEQFEQFVAVSEEAMNSFIKIGGEAKKVRVIYNPIDVENIRGKALEENIELPQNLIHIVALGRLFPQKRFDRLIKAIHRLKQDKEVPSFRLSILGEGFLQEELEQLIQDLELQDVVQILPYQPNPYPLMKAADIIALSSDFEGLPGVVCEALALSKPIVATSATGVNELLRENRGIIVEKNTEALANGLKKMMVNKELRNSYTEHLKTIQFPFDKEVVIPQLEALFLS